MRKIDLNKDWNFYENDESMSFVFSRPESKKVDLPHDYIITKPRKADAAGGPANGYFDQGEGVYTKELDVPAEWQDKTVILDIDGAYMNTEVALNEELMGLHPYGYTPYLVELTRALRFDGKSNKLKIITQSRQPSTRWYSGGGLYRSVDLWIGGLVYIKPWDLFITTPEVEDTRAEVHCAAVISNKEIEEKNVVLLYEVMDVDKKVIVSKTCELVLEAEGETRAESSLELEHPVKWDLDQPYLYTLRLTILEGEEILEVSESEFGVRTIELSVDKGFQLNGKTIKLKGGCIHHDNGLLGACAYPKAEDRKIKILQEAGYNAVRISHYPPSRTMLESCDRRGMLLLDECFDVWRMGKMPLDYHLYFEDWWERDIELMVKRDRNHPCVITYSIGNEIGERDGGSDGALWSRRINDKIKSLDLTRFTLSAICGVFDKDQELSTNFDVNILDDENDVWADKTEGYAGPLDIVGYNYMQDRYQKDHQRYPDRIMAGTETHSFYTYDCWKNTMENSYVIGDFIWAAVDYLGEVGVGKTYWKKDEEPMQFMTPYPWRTSWQSDILLTGRRRPQSYYREILWGHTENTYLFTTHPKRFGDEFYGTGWHWYDVNDDWSFGDAYVGKMVQIDAYGCGDEAEFFLNGKSMGRVPYEKYMASINLAYEMGVLEAVSYRDGEEISRAKLETAGEAQCLVLTPEEHIFSADGQDLCYVHIDVVDENGVILPADEREIEVECSAPGVIAAAGSGSPCTEDQIGESRCHVYHGSAVVILKAEQSGSIEIQVKAEGGLMGSCVIEAK